MLSQRIVWVTVGMTYASEHSTVTVCFAGHHTAVHRADRARRSPLHHPHRAAILPGCFTGRRRNADCNEAIEKYHLIKKNRTKKALNHRVCGLVVNRKATRLMGVLM